MSQGDQNRGGDWIPTIRKGVNLESASEAIMRTRTIRLGALLGILLVFFLPILPLQPPATICPFTYCIGILPSFQGYQSLGFFLIGLGAVYGGYTPQALSYGFESEWVSTPSIVGVLLWDFLPIAVACIWLLAPEVVRFSKVSRSGFGGFGAALFLLADLMLISMLQQDAFVLPFALTGVFFGASGILMVMFAMHTWPLGLWEREDSPRLE